jgi:nucleoside-diphosphate-sugar epimerase
VTAAGGTANDDGLRIALTGATGFLGSHIADTLLARGYRVRASVRATSNLCWLEGKSVETVQVDLTDPGDCRKFLDDTSGLIHCAGVVNAPAEEIYQLGNVTTTVTLLEAAAHAWAGGRETAAFVLISSLAAHGPASLDQPAIETNPCSPVTAYGRSKLAGEKLLDTGDWPFRTVILRPPALYGPRDREFMSLLSLARRGWSGRIGRSMTGLSLVHGVDAAAAAVDLLETPTATGPFFVDDGQAGYGWNDLAAVLGQMAGRKVRVLPIPLGLLKFVSWLIGSKRASRSVVLNRDRIRDLESCGWVCRGDKLTAATGFRARYSAQAGFTDTLDFYLKEGWL